MSDSKSFNWQSIAQCSCEALSIRHQTWLEEAGSLTQRLSQLHGAPIRVQVEYEGWQMLRADECAALSLPLYTEGWVREVHLCAGAVPWVFARSVTSRKVLESKVFTLEGLGNRALGHLLFSDPAFSRGPIEICRYPVSGFWARRSIFQRGVSALLVAEVFLPEFWSAVFR